MTGERLLLHAWERRVPLVMSDAYAECVGGSLKLKGVSSGGVKK